MSFVPLVLNPGVYKDDTPLSAEGLWSDSNQIRFVRDRLQTRQGMEYATATQFAGICRGLHSWIDSLGLPYCGVGTSSNVYALFDGSLYDITPVISRGQTSLSFTTLVTSATVTLDWTSHGLVADQELEITVASTASVGGVTLVGRYTVASVVTANQITFVADQVATSSAGPTAVTCNWLQYLAPGLVDGLGVGGYGTGGYGSGGYGSSSATTLYLRSYSLYNWSQNLLANPRGGGIYEWSPKFVATELVTNGSFLSSVGWSSGTGWAINTSIAAAVATAGVASDLSTTVTLAAASWFVLEADVTVLAGTLLPKIGTTSIGTAVSSAGHITRTFYSRSGSLTFTKDATYGGTLKNVTVKQLVNLEIVPNAPTQNTCMLVTPEFMCMALGTVERTSGNFNPLCIRTSDQFANPANTGIPLQTWTPTSSNQSIETYLAEGGRIVGAKNGPGGVYVWTDTAFYIGRYVNDPNIVYRFDVIGTGCGLIGPNAACIVGSVAYWMGNNGQFWMYAGGVPTPIESTCRRDVFDHLALSQGDKVFAAAVNAFSEAQWNYPDSRDGSGVECSRYVKLNAAANSSPVWDVALSARTAWIDKQQLDYPIAAGTDGYLYFQDKDFSINGGALSWSATTGAYQLGDGNNLWKCNGIIIDFEDMQGSMMLEVYIYIYPQSTPTLVGTFTLTKVLEKIDFIAVGRQIAFKFYGNTAPCFARFGSLRIDTEDTGMQF